MNLALYLLHMAVMMMVVMVMTMMHRSGLGRHAEGKDRRHSYCRSKNQIFHVEPLKHWGTMLRGSRIMFMCRIALTAHEHALTFVRATIP